MSADWLRKDKSQDKSKKDAASKKSDEGNQSLVQKNKEHTKASENHTSAGKWEARSDKKNANGNGRPKTAETRGSSSDHSKKSEGKPASQRPDSKKNSPSHHKPSSTKPNLGRSDRRRDIYPSQRHYPHPRRRSQSPMYHRGPRIPRHEPRSRHHESPRRDDYEFHHRRYHDERDSGHHRILRSRSPVEHGSYRRGSPDVRRMGRQPELTFEDIYVIIYICLSFSAMLSLWKSKLIISTYLTYYTNRVLLRKSLFIWFYCNRLRVKEKRSVNWNASVERLRDVG